MTLWIAALIGCPRVPPPPQPAEEPPVEPVSAPDPLPVSDLGIQAREDRHRQGCLLGDTLVLFAGGGFTTDRVKGVSVADGSSQWEQSGKLAGCLTQSVLLLNGRYVVQVSASGEVLGTYELPPEATCTAESWVDDLWAEGDAWAVSSSYMDGGWGRAYPPTREEEAEVDRRRCCLTATLSHDATGTHTTLHAQRQGRQAMNGCGPSAILPEGAAPTRDYRTAKRPWEVDGDKITAAWDRESFVLKRTTKDGTERYSVVIYRDPGPPP